MNVHRIRAEMRMGKSIYDIPLRVTYYARVSTDKDEQINSLGNQVQYYTEFIQSKPNWTFVPGYVDEGISGTSTKKRDSFNRMIRDAKAGLFNFIITKEISRFSRSTLDSIQYTQELLEYDVGVLFQNDNINTLDSDSEFRLVVMAGVAQDEVRKLSERLKFGFRQAIKNGHVLGNDNLWGYDKKDCGLTINEAEAQVVRRIFDLYANQQIGIRRISQILYDEGFTSRKGNAFNVLTIRHVLCNPKYKGWYCANKSQTVDYRTKRKIFLDENEWIMYPDPSIPAIVSEELWDRANALYKSRSQQMMSHQRAASFHNRYPYSGKIVCEEHGTSFHRTAVKTKTGETELWRCRQYQVGGKKSCSMPAIRSTDLNIIMTKIFRRMVIDKTIIINAIMEILRLSIDDKHYAQDIHRLEKEIVGLKAKKERLLEMSLSDIITMQEFKYRNDELNKQLNLLETRLMEAQNEERKSVCSEEHMKDIEKVLERELSFENGIDANLITSVLDKIVVKKGSKMDNISLEIQVKSDEILAVSLERDTLSFCFNPSL